MPTRRATASAAVEFLLEDYIPERLDFTLKPAKPIIAPGEPVELSLDARFLYGAPASGLDVTGAIRLEAVEGAALAGLPGYVAGLADDDFTTVESQFTDKVQTDAKGHADLSVDLPEGASTRPLEAKLIVDVAEPGGRTVERTVTLPVRAKSVMIGVKQDFDASLSAGDVATFEAIAVAPDGARVARKGAEWSLYQVTNDYQWFNADGRWSYEPVKSSKRIAAGAIDIGADAPAKFSAPRRLGRASARHQDAGRRGDERHLRRRLVGHGERRHARQCRRDARQDELCAGRRGQAAHRLRIRRQGDGRARSAIRSSASSTSISSRATTSCRSRSAPTGAPAPMRWR